MARSNWMRALIVCLVSLALVGCSDDDPALPVIADSYTATLSSSSNSVTGSLDIQVGTPVSAIASGNVIPATVEITVFLNLSNVIGTITLTGSIDDETGFFSATDGTYTISGTINGNAASGTISGPDLNASFTGLASDAGTIVAYCGSWFYSTQSGTAGSPLAGGISSGTFSLVTGGGVAVAAVSDFDEGIVFLMTGTEQQGIVDLNFSSAGETLDAEGAIKGSSISGSWSNSDLEEGFWSGSVSACSASD